MIDAGEVDPTFLGHSHLFSWPELNDVCTLMHSDVKAGDRFGVFQDADTGGFVLSEVKR